MEVHHFNVNSENKHSNGAFTLSNTETEADNKTNKLAQNPTGICDGVHICAV